MGYFMLQDSLLYILPFITLFFGVFIGSLFIIPKIRRISLKNHLTDSSGYRSSHVGNVPSFGGVAFYISYILVLFFSQTLDNHHVSLTLLASISIVFFTGFLDDLKDLSPKLKFLGQFLAVGLLMIQPDFRITSLHGFIGIYEIPLTVSIAGSMFFLLGLINAFNLIDGIDGLTGITGIIVASFYAFMFYSLANFFYAAIAVTTIATLLAFLRFNFSIQWKIFMGDTGSLVIGLVLGLLTLKLMSFGDEAYVSLSFNRAQLPLFLIAVLFVPLLDTLRVMLVRAINGVSIFEPDRNHIHHIIIDFGLSHRRASFLIGLSNFLAALLMFFVIQLFDFTGSLLVLGLMLFLAIFILFLMNKNKTAIRIKVKIRQSLLRLF